MKQENSNYAATGEITALNCDVYDAILTISCHDQKTATAEYPPAKNVFVGEKDGALYIRQSRRSLFSKKQQLINICLPEHVLCDINLCGQKPSVGVSSGIYGTVSANLDGGDLTLCACDIAEFEMADGGANIRGANIRFNRATVKGGLIARIRSGNIIAENTFAMRAECKVGKGNIGFSNFTCKNCGLETTKGNICAILNGDEKDFSASIVSKYGTVNKESFINENASGKIRAYAERGGITLEFSESENKQKAKND